MYSLPTPAHENLARPPSAAPMNRSGGDIPYDSSGQTVPAYDCKLSPNDHDFVVLAPVAWTDLEPPPPEPGPPTPGDPTPVPTPSLTDSDKAGGQAGEPGYRAWVTTHPIRAEYTAKGTDLTFHRAGVMICPDGYKRPVWRSGRDGRYCIGEFWVWNQRDGETQIGSGYKFGLMVNDQPETSIAMLSSSPGGWMH